MIETKQLQYFIKCAELESFSKAADELHTTQPNVSKVIKTFEDELGIELFIRLKNKIVLNETGREIFRYSCEVMENLQQIQVYVEKIKAERKKN